MKLRFNWSVTTKLLLVNSLILAIFIGIILLVQNSFHNIKSSLATLIDRDITQVIENAQLGRDLSRVFSEATYTIDDYIDRQDQLQKRGNRLITTITDLSAKSSDTELQAALGEFVGNFKTLLAQTITIIEMVKTSQGIDQELTIGLKNIEDAISEKLIVVVMEGKDTSNFEQISTLMPGYRETLLQITIEVANMQHEMATAEEGQATMTAEEQYPVLFSLLNDLALRFRTLTASDAEIAEHGQQLITLVDRYKEMIVKLHQSMIEFQAHNQKNVSVKERVLSILARIDERIAQAAELTQVKAANIMDSSRNTILVMSWFFVVIQAIGWLIIRWMTTPLKQLSQHANQLADGDIECEIQQKESLDEIGMLSRAFQKLITYFQEMAYTATEISQGKLEIDVRPKSDKDVLGNRFQQMIAYLKDISEVATHVAQGNLRSKVTLHSQTDHLGGVFIHMQKGLIALISEILSRADDIASISSQVLSTSAKNAAALNQIGNAADVTSSAMREVSASAEEVRMNTEHLTSSVEETSSSINQMISSIKHVAENSRKLSEFAKNTTLIVADIVNSLEKAANQAEDSKTLAETTTQDARSGQESVEQMIAKMTTISEVTQNISNIIGQLESRSLAIDTILDVINEVADQTSMLSLNASIIAAQAGTYGRGFAVVADEIKELADRVGTSTKEIASIIKSVQQDSSNAVQAIEQGQSEVESGVMVAHKAGEALHKIRQSAVNSSEVAAEIALLVRQQTHASTRIAEAIQDETNMISEITRATQEQDSNSSQLLTVVETMQTLGSQVLRATQEQQKSTRHVTEFMADVTTLVEENAKTVKELERSANELADQADALKKQVTRFTLPKQT